MKKSFILIFTFFCIIHSHAQDRKSLEERALKWYTYCATEKYDSLVNYMHSSAFISISKSDYIKDMKNIKSEQLTISPVHTPPNFYFGEIKKAGENYYCILYHDQTMKAKFHDEVIKEEKDFYVEYAKKRFQADKAVFNNSMNALLLLTRMKTIAIADKENNYLWTFEPNIKDRGIREQLGL